MEVGILAGKNVVGAHLALCLAYASEVGNVPMSKDGRRLVERVHLFENGENRLGERLNPSKRDVVHKVEDWIDDPLVPKRGTCRWTYLETHHWEAEMKKSKALVALKRCKCIILFTGFGELQLGLKCVKKSIEKGTGLICIPGGLGYFELIEDMFKDEVKEKSMMLFFGATTYGVNRQDNRLVRTSFGALMLSRLPRDAPFGKLQLQCLESTGLPRLTYRSLKYRSNWMFGELVWKLYDGYAAIVFHEAKPMSLYEQLTSDIQHRLAYSVLLEEALRILSKDDQLNFDTSGSPFGLGIHRSRFLLRFPNLMFSIVLRLVLTLTLTGSVARLAGNRHENPLALEQALEINGLIVDRAMELGFDSPLNAIIVERCKRGKFGPLSPTEIEKCRYPKPLNIIAALLIIIGAIATFVLPCIFFYKVFEIFLREYIL